MKRIPAILFALAIFVPSLAQAESMRDRSFTLADINNNTTLEKEEFRSFINLLADAGNRNAKRVRTFYLYKLAWQFVDKNGDGFATRKELLYAKTSFEAGGKKIRVSVR